MAGSMSYDLLRKISSRGRAVRVIIEDQSWPTCHCLGSLSACISAQPAFVDIEVDFTYTIEHDITNRKIE